MPTTETIQLENALDKTLVRLINIENGVEEGFYAIRNWQLDMYGLGLLPDFVTYNPETMQLEGVPQDENSLVITALSNIITASTNSIKSQATNYWLDIKSSLNFTENNVINAIDDMYDDIEILEYTLAAQTQSLINNLDFDTNGIIDGVTSNVQDLFVNQSNRIEAFRAQQTNTLLDKSTNDTQQILNAVNAIGFSSGGGGGDINVEVQSAWTPQRIAALLTSLGDINSTLITKDLVPDIENVINVNGDDGTDSSASTNPIMDIFTGEWLAELFGQAFITEMGNDVGGIGERLNALINILTKATTNQYTSYDELMTEFNNAVGTGNVTEFILKAVLVIPTLLSAVMNITQPFVNNIETLARTVALDGLLPPDTIREMYIRKHIDKPTLYDHFSKIGYSQQLSDEFIYTATVQLPEMYAREAFLRGFITQGEHDEYLVRLGYLSDDLALIRKTYMRIPPVPDLIRFAVREAYDETLAQDLQLDSGYDTIKDRFEKDLIQNGLDPDYGKFYWRSHWDLPSPSQAYEMLHRGVITKQELSQLLKVSDYSPEWIDKLTAISYSPYTRVDIRRMHKVGVLTGTEVVEAYKDIGYDVDKATKLAQFTIQLNEDIDVETNKDLSQSNILRAYKVALLDRNTARTMLIQLGYNERESNILLDMQDLGVTVDKKVDVLADNKRRIINMVSKAFIEGTLSEQASRFYLQNVGYLPTDIDLEIQTLRNERNILLQNERINNVMKGYIEFRYDENDVRSELAKEGFTPFEENDIFALWNTQRKNRYTNPTKAELKKWYIVGHTTFSETANYLRSLGYDNKLVDLYMQDFQDARDSQV